MGNNNTNENDKKSSTTQSLTVASEYYDPVEFNVEVEEGKEIIKTGDAIVITTNKFYGYFGFGRIGDTGIRIHSGYDYKANVGTSVKAVHRGEITKVRFGRKKCWINDYFKYTQNLSFTEEDINNENTKKTKNDIIENEINNINKKIENLSKEIIIINEKIKNIDANDKIKLEEAKKQKEKEKKKFEKEKKEKEQEKKEEIKYCTYKDEKGDKKKCLYIGACYGVQLFLKVSGTKKYAVYSHLSGLDPKVFEDLKKKFKFNYSNHTLTPKNPKTDPIEVKGNVTIGKSGATGLAATIKEDYRHLHFECKETDTPGSEGCCSPNEIVNTEFTIKNTKNSEKPHFDKIKESDIIEYRVKAEYEKNKKQIEKEIEDKKREEFLLTEYNQFKQKNPSLPMAVFDKLWKGFLLTTKFDWNETTKQEALKEYMAEKIDEGVKDWENIKKKQDSFKALEKFKEEHVIVVEKIKNSQGNTKEIDMA